ncbi:MAG: sulfite exporter TauE/SafE family protein [Thermodesulfovibrionales bacterium]
MYFYLPVALTSINILIPTGLGLVIGLLVGLFGVGGGFLITPLLMMFGIPATVAAATGSNQIVGASATGTYAHWKMGNVDFKMGFLLLAGGFLGGLGGVHVIKVLSAMGNADFVIRVTYVVMLGLVGTYMLVESLSKSGKKPAAGDRGRGGLGRFLDRLPLQIRFEKSGVTYSAIVPIAVGGVVGVLAAVMGVGGGFLMVPVMLYVFRMPMNVVVGTSLFQILFTCIEVTFLQAYTNHNVDFLLAVLLLAGSTVGAQFGAALGKRLNSEQLKIILACIVLAVTVKIVFELVLQPSILLAEGR